MTRSGGSRNAGTAGDLYCEIEGVPVTLREEDLSTAGFFIETSTPYAMDRELEIYVRSSVGELFARGQVVQVVGPTRARSQNRRAGYGLLFTSLEDDQRAFIGLTLDALTRARALAVKAPSAPPAPRLPSAPPPPKPPSVHPPKTPSAARPKPQLTQPAVTEDVVARKAIEAELRAELSKVQGKTAWTALGLEADAPLGGAKEAFLRLSKRFHPHKYARHNSPEITKLATEVFIAYKRAYDLLTKLAPRPAQGHPPDGVPPAARAVTSIAPAAQATTNSMRPAGGRPRSR
jgi:hypothetical protein